MTEEKAQPQAKRPLTLKTLDNQMGLMNARLDLLGVAFERYEKREEERDEAASRPKTPTESDALQRCVNALQAIAPEKSAYGYSSNNHAINEAAIMRILRYLADRFKIDLVEIREQPCSRQHVDEITPEALHNALSAVAGSYVVGA